jgi:hypothetical protein
MRTKFIAAAVAGMALAFSMAAQAESWFSLEAGVGASHYSGTVDDLWWQQGMPHDLHLSAPAWRVGVQFNAVNYQPESWVPGVALHLVYLNAAQASMRSIAAPDEDPNVYNNVNGGYYNTATHSCDKYCGPERNFVSGGRLQAFALTIEPFWERGKWRFGIEAGPALFRSTWDATATSLTDTPWWGPAGSVETFHHTPKWEVGAVVGASVGYGPWSLRYNYILAKSKNDSTVPPGFNGVHMLTMNFAY